jgi:methyltransferase
VSALAASEWAYLGLVGLVAVERLFELARARRNARWAFAHGGREVGRGHYPVMVALHTALLVAAPLEVILAGRPFLPLLAAPALALVLVAQALRAWCIRSLGVRWNTRVIVVPGLPAVTGGPYRWLRHPNYLAVVLEVAALPLVHGAWLTAVVFSAANAWLLAHRIAVEETALGALTDWAQPFAPLGRLLPVGRAPGAAATPASPPASGAEREEAR